MKRQENETVSLNNKQHKRNEGLGKAMLHPQFCTCIILPAGGSVHNKSRGKAQDTRKRGSKSKYLPFVSLSKRNMSKFQVPTFSSIHCEKITMITDEKSRTYFKTTTNIQYSG